MHALFNIMPSHRGDALYFADSSMFPQHKNDGSSQCTLTSHPVTPSPRHNVKQPEPETQQHIQLLERRTSHSDPPTCAAPGVASSQRLRRPGVAATLPPAAGVASQRLPPAPPGVVPPSPHDAPPSPAPKPTPGVASQRDPRAGVASTASQSDAGLLRMGCAREPRACCTVYAYAGVYHEQHATAM
jgi:hypothetical protein